MKVNGSRFFGKQSAIDALEMDYFLDGPRGRCEDGAQ